MSDPIKTLRDEDVAVETGTRRWFWLSVFILVVIGSGVASVWWLMGDTGTETTPVSSTTTTSPPDPKSALAPFTSDLVFMPQMVPAGLSECSAAQGTKADFCADNEQRQLTVAMRPSSTVPLETGSVVDDWDRAGARWIFDNDVRTLAIPLNASTTLVVSSATLNEATLVAVAQSIPLVADSERFAADYTDPLDPFSISDETVAAILGIEVADVYRGGGFIVSRRSDARGLRLLIDPAAPLLDAAAALRHPQFLPQLSHPAVGGGLTGSLEGTSVIVWSQRGVNWTLLGGTDIETLADTVEQAEAVIDAIVE